MANPRRYAEGKLKAAQLAARRGQLAARGARSPSASSRSGSTTAAAVFGSLNAEGLSAAGDIKLEGQTANVTPPDTTGAIGPNHYVEIVNGAIAAYDRTSLALVGSPVGISKFTGGVEVCDPQIKYDPQTSRWFYVAIRCDGTATENTLYMGFSKTSDPTDLSTAVGHGWCAYSYPTGEALEDYPKLGLDSLHIIVGSNSFKVLPEQFLTAHIFSLPKPATGAIGACPAAPKLTPFPNAGTLKTSVGHKAITPQPATVADESPSGFVVAADTVALGEGKNIMIWKVAGSTSAPTLEALGAPAVTPFSLPPNVPQEGSTDTIDSLDSRLTQAVAAADPAAGGVEAVWTQHTVAGGAGSAVRWYELVPSKLEVRQAGAISDPSSFIFNGAIAPTRSGGAVIDYDTASGKALVQIVAQSRTGSTPAGTMNTPITLGSSSAIDSDFSCPSQPYGKSVGATSCRWGDYAGASADPSNANVVWGSNQLNGPTGAPNPRGNAAQWATRNFALEPTEVPHYYSNNALVGPEPKTVIGWGTLTLKTVVGASGEVTCHTVDAGTIDNPAGGGSGVGSAKLFATYKCESTTCSFASAVTAESLPWPSTLEAEKGVIRAKTTGVKLKVDCLKEGKSEGSETFVGAEAPRFHNGTSALHPGLLEFDAGSGTLEREGSKGGALVRNEGEVKTIGFTEQEVISTK